MAYTYKNKRGVTYFLHQKQGTGTSGKGKLFFFAKEARDNDGLDEIPDGYKIEENKRTGLPILKRSDKIK